MQRKNCAVMALLAAVAGTTLFHGSSRPVRGAEYLWEDHADRTGAGTDPNAATNLNGLYRPTLNSNWNLGNAPGAADNITFNAPGYPSIPYTVNFSQNEQANRITVLNDPVTLNLAQLTHHFTMTLNQTSFVPNNNASLFVGDKSSLTFTGGVLNAKSMQIGTTSATTSNATTFLTIDGNHSAATGILNVADNSTITNYQTINVINEGVLQLGANVTINQIADLGGPGGHSGTLIVSGFQSSISFGNGDMIRGGTLRASGSALTGPGTTITLDSVFVDGELGADNGMTVNLASNQVDPNHGNAAIPTTIRLGIFLGSATININGSVVQLSADSGNTWSGLSIVGDGQLNVTNAILNAGQAYFDSLGPTGPGSHVTIDPSLVSFHGDMTVGDFGSSTVAITGGGNIVTIDGQLILGNSPGGQGSLTVSGLSSFFSIGNDSTQSAFGSGDLLVGSAGSGVLTISAGAQFTITNGFNALIGASDNGDGTAGAGTVTVTGGAIDAGNQSVVSSLSMTGDLSVGIGNNAHGVLQILNGGSVENFNGAIGVEQGSTGSVVVDGAFANPNSEPFASVWTNDGVLVIGGGGTGSLTISNFGEASATFSVFMGDQASGNGTLIVETSGALLVGSNSESFIVGNNGSGTVHVLSGGLISILGSMVIGANGGSSGIVTVDGAESFISSNDATEVGRSGTASLQITNGGAVFDETGYVGEFAGSHASVTVAGGGAAWENDNTLFIGANSFNGPDQPTGNGTLTVGAGGSVSAGTTIVGPTGVVVMQGGTLTSFSNTLRGGTIHGFGNITGPITGNGTIQADTGGTLITDQLQAAALLVNGTHVIRPTTAPNNGSATSVVQTLTIAGGTNAWTGKLDVGNNPLIILNTSSTNKATVLANAYNQVKSGSAGNWTGNGITSSTVTSNTNTTLAVVDAKELFGPAGGIFKGQTVDANSVIIDQALQGDADLNGIVDFNDLVTVAHHFNQTGIGWALGNFDVSAGSNIVDFNDLVAVAHHFNQTFHLDADAPGGTLAPVPEPAGLAMMAIGSALLWRRSRRRRGGG